MPLHHPAIIYPVPQVIRDYWQDRLSELTAPASEHGAIKYALDFFAMVRQQEIKAGSSYCYAWTLYPQAPAYCCQALVQTLHVLAVAADLLVDATAGWTPSGASPEVQRIAGLLPHFAREELQRIQQLYLAIQQELFQIAQEHQLLITVENIQLEVAAVAYQHTDPSRELRVSA